MLKAKPKQKKYRFYARIIAASFGTRAKVSLLLETLLTTKNERFLWVRFSVGAQRQTFLLFYLTGELYSTQTSFCAAYKTNSGQYCYSGKAFTPTVITDSNF